MQTHPLISRLRDRSLAEAKWLPTTKPNRTYTKDYTLLENRPKIDRKNISNKVETTLKNYSFVHKGYFSVKHSYKRLRFYVQIDLIEVKTGRVWSLQHKNYLSKPCATVKNISTLT